MPCFMNIVRITGYTVNLTIDVFEFFIFICQILQLGRANKGKVCRIEEKYAPFAFYVFVGYCCETYVLESLNVELEEL